MSDSLKEGNNWNLVILILLLLGIAIGVIFLSLDNRPVELTNIDNIEYKSIETSSTPIRYFAIDSDGNVYKISQEDWASLDVPIISGMVK